jgi:hypothetical protein
MAKLSDPRPMMGCVAAEALTFVAVERELFPAIGNPHASAAKHQKVHVDLASAKFGRNFGVQKRDKKHGVLKPAITPEAGKQSKPSRREIGGGRVAPLRVMDFGFEQVLPPSLSLSLR